MPIYFLENALDLLLKTHVYLYFYFTLGRVSLCSLGSPRIFYVDQAGFQLTEIDPLGSASSMLGLKVCVSTHLASQGSLNVTG